jgi:hypothetical protein
MFHRTFSAFKLVRNLVNRNRYRAINKIVKCENGVNCGKQCDKGFYFPAATLWELYF